MGESYVNFMGGSPLNRLSWLRTSQSFLNAILQSPSSRWLVFKQGQPLIATEPSVRTRLALLSTADVKPLLGSDPVFSQGQKEGEYAPSDVSVLEAARLRGLPIVFLGLHEPQTSTADALPSSEFSAKTDAALVVANIHGTPYFSLDVSDASPEQLDALLQNAEVARRGSKLAFSEARMAMGMLDVFEASIFAQGRSLVDWNSKNKFCPSCGSPVHSVWAGWKLACSSLLPWADAAGKPPCATAKGVHNFSHPRTDPVVIMAIIDESGQRMLLGRNKKWPILFFSALAGFIEPGESFEDAVRREIWEEAGVKVWDVKYHSTQPWPYPANLMVGFYARASAEHPIRTDLDNELEEARWFTREEIVAVLDHVSGTTLTSTDHKAIEDSQQQAYRGAKEGQAEAATTSDGGPPFKMPPLTAIAGVLIHDWAREHVVFEDIGTLQKGNL